MSRKADRLRALERIARVKADRELHRFTLYRTQAETMRQQVETIRAELVEAMRPPEADGLAPWRLASALVGYRAAQLHRAEVAFDRMKPGLDAARAAAAQAFGRVEALAELRRLTAAGERQDRERRGN